MEQSTKASTAARVYLEIEGQPVPARDCCWIETAPCGCHSGVMMAEVAGDVYTTAEQAAASYYANKVQAKRAADEGSTLALVTHEAFRAMPFGDCQHDPKWGVPAVDLPEGMAWGTLDHHWGRRGYMKHIVPADSFSRPGEKYPPVDIKAACGKPAKGWWHDDEHLLWDCVTCRKCEQAATA